MVGLIFERDRGWSHERSDGIFIINAQLGLHEAKMGYKEADLITAANGKPQHQSD
jgi:hypothetical protein